MDRFLYKESLLYKCTLQSDVYPYASLPRQAVTCQAVKYHFVGHSCRAYLVIALRVDIMPVSQAPACTFRLTSQRGLYTPVHFLFWLI